MHACMHVRHECACTYQLLALLLQDFLEAELDVKKALCLQPENADMLQLSKKLKVGHDRQDAVEAGGMSVCPQCVMCGIAACGGVDVQDASAAGSIGRVAQGIGFATEDKWDLPDGGRRLCGGVGQGSAAACR